MARVQTKRQADLDLRVIDATMRLAARMRWHSIRIRDIAQEAELTVAEALTIFPTKCMILEAFSNMVDQAVLADLEVDTETLGNQKDALFDILMLRFENMTCYKPALASLFAELKTDPFVSLNRLVALRSSMALSLEAVGISTSGLGGKIRTHALMLIYGYCFHVWLRDESADLSATMAAVDRCVSMAENLSTRACRRNGGVPSKTE